MNWVDYQKRRRELHIAKADADDHGDGRRWREAEAAIDKLEEEHSRRYVVGPQHVARVLLRGSMRPWLSIETLDEDGTVRIYSTEFGAIPADAMLHCAVVQRYIDRYVAGEIDELPPESTSLESPRILSTTDLETLRWGRNAYESRVEGPHDDPPVLALLDRLLGVTPVE